ncbi:zinc finger CCCH domain-containing protein 17-like [Panicum virgatum]|uniref:zinc finger CCCH domain-containing protein 17-like n=1 Tax=Panicum virgatum TaxID=38727 RepID=UPI0019D52CC0|nr:zinc finger CCCH domain-containing protein 17-like [Panicum virgatum]
MGFEVVCMISEGMWFFIDIPDSVKVWNMQTAAEMNLTGSSGKVYALVVATELIFAATQRTSNCIKWKGNLKQGCIECLLKGVMYSNFNQAVRVW